MRRSLFILTLSGLTVLAIAGDAFAQRRGNGGRGNASNYSRGGGRAYASPRYGNSYYGGGGYYRGYGYWPGYYQPYLGAGILGAGIFGYSYATPYYGVNPGAYSYAPPVDSQQSFYSGPGNSQRPAAAQPATMTVIVPTADAQLWFENSATTQQGAERQFTSPPLEPGHYYAYTIKTRWLENGETVERTRQVNIQAGQAITVNIGRGAREILPPPASSPRN